jgi:hypothetical protein
MSNSTRHTLGNLLSALVVLAAGLLIVALATRGLVQSPTPEPTAGVTTVSAPPGTPAAAPTKPAPAKTTVHLIIDYGDGVQKHFNALAHTAGMTVLDALLAAKAHPRGIKLDSTGKGETAFLNAIDDLKNQGTGKDKKNWQFFVNDKFATRSMGVATLNPADTVRLVFDTWKGN